MHKPQVITFLFCFFSIQFAPGVNSLSFSFVGVVDDKTDSGGCELLMNFCLPLFWANVECVSDSKSLQVHSEVIWGLHSALQSEEVIYE